VLFLALLANAARETTGKLVGLQALTIVFGFAGAMLSGVGSYAAFAAGAACFVGVAYLLYNDVDASAAASLPEVEVSLYRSLRNFVVVLWSVYPVVWLLGASGVGLMDVETASLVIVYLDVVTKVGFGIIALQGWMTLGTDDTRRDVTATAD